jgi:hypothetical protein
MVERASLLHRLQRHPTTANPDSYMSHHPTLVTPLLHRRPARPADSAHRPPSVVARGATLARMLFVPGAAEQILHDMGDDARP